VDITDLVTPIASSDWNKLELGSNQSALDGNLDFLANLDTETDVAVLVTDDNNGLEASSLTGLGLLLDRDDLHDFVRKGLLLEEFIDDLGLLDGDGVGVNFLEGLDLASLDESAKLGLGNPFILGRTTTAWAIATATATTAATSASSETAFAIPTSDSCGKTK